MRKKEKLLSRLEHEKFSHKEKVTCRKEMRGVSWKAPSLNHLRHFIINIIMTFYVFFCHFYNVRGWRHAKNCSLESRINGKKTMHANEKLLVGMMKKRNWLFVGVSGGGQKRRKKAHKRHTICNLTTIEDLCKCLVRTDIKFMEIHFSSFVFCYFFLPRNVEVL